MPTKENKVVEILGKKFEVVKTDNDSCDGCYFYTRHCVPKALRNCIWGGNILKLIEQR